MRSLWNIHKPGHQALVQFPWLKAHAETIAYIQLGYPRRQLTTHTILIFQRLTYFHYIEHG